MFFQTEAKVQGWRALAVFNDRTERLIYVGRSTTHIREGYGQAFLELFDDEERSQVRGIELQCWLGAADRGHWVQKGALPIPQPKPVQVPVLAGKDSAGPRILPFRRSLVKEPAEEISSPTFERPRRFVSMA